MFSRSAGYAVQALAYLAAQPSGKLAGAREIATATSVPMPFLWKILRNLSRRKLVRSFKGVRGGYELARPAERISVRQILNATQEPNLFTGCVLGLNDCHDDHPCVLHPTWRGIRSNIDRAFSATTLADLAGVARVSQRRKTI